MLTFSDDLFYILWHLQQVLVLGVYMDGGMYSLQNSYVYYKLESKDTSNYYVTSKRPGHFEKKIYD